MIVSKDLILFSYLTILTASAATKVPTGAPWANFVPKSAYARALGPPISGMDTIKVPYMPKSPFFPKFVDPKTMISKKTDLLNNLFGGLGPVYPIGLKPFMPYSPVDGSSLYSTTGETQLLNNLDKSGMTDGTDLYKRGIFGPFGSKPFGPMSSKFGPMSPFSGLNTIPDYSMKDEFSRRKRSIDVSPVAKLRSIMDGGKPATKDLGPPPPYPTLAPISGMFGPFGPMIDPSMFIAKKSAFLDTLFKNLATTTSSPTSTETLTTQSTIVPPDFWLPSSVNPSPTEYNEKVTNFLDKLFESIKLNKSTMATSNDDNTSVKNDLVRSAVSDGDDETQVKIARSVEDLSSINAAKDSIVDSILSELGDLKSNMVTTMNDLVSYEKSATSLSSKKPFKPFASIPWSKPAADGTLPFQQKMALLSQVFDMLTDLQKNITLTIQNVIKAKMTSANVPEKPFNANYPMVNDIFSTTDGMPINMSLLDAIKSKLATLDYGTPLSYDPNFGKFGPQMARTLPKSPASFWVSYPEDAANIKREVDSDTESLLNDKTNFNAKQQTRSVKMQMHQGYQSLPAGSVESVEAGGGSTPGHQGGGMKLLDTDDYKGIDRWDDWMEYLQNYRGHRHHNHH